ncbi:MAG TPA: butyrate kinase [Terracidiphilus sp.]|nr:butyrate kinase [Terracidiphilus sp.]
MTQILTQTRAVFGGDSSSRAYVLAINPGSTSTKFGLYGRRGAKWVRIVRHGDEELRRFGDRPMVARLEYRAAMIAQALEELGYAADQVAGVAGRGGLLPPLPCGTYLVDGAMVDELYLGRRGEHASNLGALLALRFAQAADVEAYIVDPVTADEWQDCARLSGSPLIERSPIGHVLNTRAVARRYARERKVRYEDLRLIVAHMGSGITVSAHRLGRMIDSNTIEEGPFGPDRTGGLPVRALIKLCYSGQFAQKEMDHKAFGNGGLYAYLGTRDLMEVEKRIDAGDPDAALVWDAMAYQIAKETGAMATVLQGHVDALVLTGGMAHSERLTGRVGASLEWIAPITVYPGEDELQALAEGVFRVLDGEEKAKRFSDEIRNPAQVAVPRPPLVIGIE